MEELKTSSRRSRRTRQQIADVLADFSKGDLTVKEFCELHQISRGTFHKWQSRVKSGLTRKGGSPGFAKVMVSLSPPTALFAEVNGIRIYQPVVASYLKELLP